MVNTKNKYHIIIAGIISVTSGVVAGFNAMPKVEATDPCASTAAGAVNPCTTRFNVNVIDSLTVKITTPSQWVSGNTNTFLRNKVNLNVSTTNDRGYTASMYSLTTSNLSNGSQTIPTLASNSTRSSFPSNRWGYSLSVTSTDITTTESDTGKDSAIYSAMGTSSSSPELIRQVTTKPTADQQSTDIYFGAKADASQAAGTYSGQVVITVVTPYNGVADNPTPTDSDDTTQDDNYATYHSGSQSSVAHWTGTGTSSNYHYYTTSGSTDTTAGVNREATEVIKGNYTQALTNPLGVTTTTAKSVSSVNNALATGLLVTATVAASSGLLFFLVGRRRDDDDDEEENQYSR